MPEQLIFVSYCHEDKTYKDAFEKALKGILRHLNYEVWIDSLMFAGDGVDTTIDQALESSSVFVALVSSDYLASDACSHELEEAKRRNRETGEPVIIPVILRSCEWKNHFDLNPLALPSDATPVSTWPDTDDAWRDVARQLRERLEGDSQVVPHGGGSAQVNLDIESRVVPLSQGFVDQINTHGLVLQHNKKETIRLSDIFIFPDLREIGVDDEKIEREINSSDLIDATKAPPHALILGDEQSGKSSLCSMLFVNLHEAGYHPLILDGSQISRAQPDQYIQQAISEQYGLRGVDLALDVVLIDDADDIRLNERHLPRFLTNIKEVAPRIYAFADDSLRFKESRYVLYGEFAQFDLMYFGHVRRAELIEQWVQLGQEETIDLPTLHSATDETKRNVDSIVRRNVVPPKPVFLLTIIQSLDQYTSGDVTLTSYGHCYQYLVYQALDRARIENKKVDMYLNYLTALAHFMFTRRVAYLKDEDLRRFKEEYDKSYLHDGHDRMLGKLRQAGILHETPNGTGFRYKYILYFFAAKFIAEHLEEGGVADQFLYILDNVHLERNANVVIFITHHTRRKYVFDQIEKRAVQTFSQLDPASLRNEETSHLISFIEEMPQLLLEDRSVDRERMKALRRADQADRMPDWTEDDYYDNSDMDGVRSMMRDINTSLRMVEIMGQIIRNRYGSLRREQLNQISGEAFDAGLRFLSFVLGTTDAAKYHVVEYLSQQLREHHQDSLTDKSASKVHKEAQNIFLGYCYSVIYGFLRKMAHSLGNERLTAILREISDQRGTPAAKLISVIASLEFESDLPKKDMDHLAKEIDRNPIAKRMLRQAAVQHCYLHKVEYDDRQWIADKLGIPIEKQRLIQERARSK